MRKYKTPIHLRNAAAKKQGGLCFYCRLPMWMGATHPTKRFAAVHRLTLRQAETLQCTAEHLHPRCEGGQDVAENVVAACITCNGRRQARRSPLSWERYREHVERRVALGGWHSVRLRTAQHVAVKAFAAGRSDTDLVKPSLWEQLWEQIGPSPENAQKTV